MPFTQLKLHPSLLKAVKELGFVRPTPIQAEAIPPALEGRDVIACAQTGSGKTAAFLLPILHRLLDRPRRTTKALVLAPTRELAAQILDDLNGFSVHTPITGAAVFGGVAMGPQEHAFRSGVDIIIATPGRLMDHMRSSYARLKQIEHLVLDEADRMLDMGFLPEIRRILAQLPSRRQTLFFSATMPPPIAALAREMLRDPVSIPTQRQSAPASGITQAVYPVPQDLKSSLIVHLLQSKTMTPGAGLHADQASRQPAGRLAGAGRHPLRAHSRQPIAVAADRRAGRVQERDVSGAGRHRHRRARHRRRTAGPRREFRRAEGSRTTTSTGSAAPAAPRRPARRSRSSRQMRNRICGTSSGRSAAACRG